MNLDEQRTQLLLQLAGFVLRLRLEEAEAERLIYKNGAVNSDFIESEIFAASRLRAGNY